MGIPVSILLLVVGAILAFAVNNSPSGVNIHAVGWILMAAGLLGFLLTLLFWQSWWGRGMYGGYAAGPGYDEYPARRGYGRRRQVVVEDDVPPADVPPGPPPPP